MLTTQYLEPASANRQNRKKIADAGANSLPQQFSALFTQCNAQQPSLLPTLKSIQASEPYIQLQSNARQVSAPLQQDTCHRHSPAATSAADSQSQNSC